MATNNFIETLLRLDRSSPHFPDKLSDILARREFDDSIQSLETNDLMQIIEYLDKVPRSFLCFRSLFQLTCRRPWMVCPPPVLPSSGSIVNSGEFASLGCAYHHHM